MFAGAKLELRAARAVEKDGIAGRRQDFDAQMAMFVRQNHVAPRDAIIPWYGPVFRLAPHDQAHPVFQLPPPALVG